MTVAGRFASLVLATTLAGLTPGCVLYDPQGVGDTLSAAVNTGSHTTRALNALTYGEMTEAERQALIALRLDPRDPYALYVAGMVYQATGRYDLARQYYEALLANRPQETITTVVQGMPQVRTLSDIAQANLIVVERLVGRYIPRTVAQSGRPATILALPGESVESPSPALAPPALAPLPILPPRGAVTAQPLTAPTALGMMGFPGPGPVAARPDDGESNIISRFRLLKRLMDEGLITPDEMTRRRTANLGAVLPYATPTPPARGLDRPPPSDSQVISRLKELARALETRAITPAEHSAERLAILDALLPAQPRQTEMPPLPPKDMMDGAAAVGRAERMRVAGLVSADEARGERAAIERTLDGQTAAAPASGLRQPKATATGTGSSGRIGVILATVGSEEEAMSAWDRIRRKYPEELAGMEASFPRADSTSKGPRWRVIAGPVKSRDAARTLCKQLRLYRQSCEVGGY